MELIEAVGIMLGTIILIVIWLITDIIGTWKIFKKAGEPGWKAIIPFYSTYTMYKITWHTFLFWFSGAVVIVNLVCSNLFQGNVINILGSFLALTTLGVHIERVHRLSVCFHKGVLFTVGLVFLTPVFILILAFDKSTYTYVKTDNRILQEIQNNLVVQTEKHKQRLKKRIKRSKSERQYKEICSGILF